MSEAGEIVEPSEGFLRWIIPEGDVDLEGLLLPPVLASTSISLLSEEEE
jgi:hypothetical protein